DRRANTPTLYHLQFFDLPIFQFERRRPAENRRANPDHSLICDDLIDIAFEVDERAFGDLDAVAALVGGLNRRAGVVGALGLFEHLGLVFWAHGRGLA